MLLNGIIFNILGKFQCKSDLFSTINFQAVVFVTTNEYVTYIPLYPLPTYYIYPQFYYITSFPIYLNYLLDLTTIHLLYIVVQTIIQIYLLMYGNKQLKFVSLQC